MFFANSRSVEEEEEGNDYEARYNGNATELGCRIASV
jgi:hypothetical protein